MIARNAAAEPLAEVERIVLRNSTPRMLRAFVEFVDQSPRRLLDAACVGCLFVRQLTKKIESTEFAKAAELWR